MVGTIFLALALALSLCALLCYGARTERMERYGRWLTVLSFAGSLGASIYLLVLIFGNHFEIAYVASYSSAELPAVYKFSAFWAGQQGSFLLWLLFHAAAGVILGYRQRLSAVGMCVYMVLQTLLTILVLAKSPFLPQEVAVENGVGLNPLLQDPWMAVHPPIIFLGYALLAVPFACSAAALIEGQMVKDWLETARSATISSASPCQTYICWAHLTAPTSLRCSARQIASAFPLGQRVSAPHCSKAAHGVYLRSSPMLGALMRFWAFLPYVAVCFPTSIRLPSHAR